jgi:hypothetical protein
MLVANSHRSASIVTSSNIDSISPTWTTTYTHHGLQLVPWDRVSCFANGSCYATGAIHPESLPAGALIAWTDPFKGAHPSWHAASTPGFTTCATPHTCFVDADVLPLSATNPRMAIETIDLTGKPDRRDPG